MNTTEKKTSLLLVLLSVVLMIGGSFLLCWTINTLYGGMTSALVTLTLALASLFIYVLGASVFGRSIRFTNVFHSHNEVWKSITFALLLIAAGALMICFNTAFLNPAWKPFFLSWQMLLFVVGCMCICRAHFLWGIMVSATGIFFLVEKAATLYPNVILYEHFASTYWPAIFIVLGLVIVLSFFIRPSKCCKRHPKGNWIDDYKPSEYENNDGKINYRFVFSGAEQVILDPVFKGGTIETTFGGLDLDLRRTSLAEGKTFLYVSTVFGGVEIKMPENWDIEIVSKAVAGGINDERLKINDTDHSRKLVIVCKCVFGGITVK